ncbi:NAD(P)-dependent oxidoreductase [Limnohabitans sp.]|uniref:NAD(P)-dependent oxidoreductase n=1 Tax=Limnohabitans sp. TaxID=1907725 RepID=UPI00286F84D0|nr:NAD(P)-dependent oxidoreductase [Limnohabitans sp.]
MKIGIAGTGKMGTAIAGRLLSLGHEVAVWNRTEARAEGARKLGATWAATPQALVACSEVIIGLLTDEQALDEVYLSANGLLSGAAQGKVFLEMSTVSPLKQQEMAKRVQAAGGVYIESPVGGSIGPAKEGKLMAFVGGDDAEVQKIKPLLDQMCRRVEHVGPHGAGSMMKLAINLPLMVYWQTLAEALSLIQPLGLDPKRVIDIFSDSSGGPNVLKNRGPLIAQTMIDGRTDTVNVPVDTVAKDIRAMLAHAQTLGVSLPLTSQALDVFFRATQLGLGPADSSEHLVWWQQHNRAA